MGAERVAIPPGWVQTGRYVVRKGEFRIAMARVGEAVRYAVTKGDSTDPRQRVEYRDDMKAAVAAAEGWDT